MNADILYILIILVICVQLYCFAPKAQCTAAIGTVVQVSDTRDDE